MQRNFTYCPMYMWTLILFTAWGKQLQLSTGLHLSMLEYSSFLVSNTLIQNLSCQVRMTLLMSAYGMKKNYNSSRCCCYCALKFVILIHLTYMLAHANQTGRGEIWSHNILLIDTAQVLFIKHMLNKALYLCNAGDRICSKYPPNYLRCHCWTAPPLHDPSEQRTLIVSSACNILEGFHLPNPSSTTMSNDA